MVGWLFCSMYAYTSPVPEDTELVNYRKPGFFSKFAELNQVMWNTNKGLTDSHPYDSRPQVRKLERPDRPLFGGIILC
jgi:dolichyl-phosphate-mannose--protein O-mannosyl transferase